MRPGGAAASPSRRSVDPVDRLPCLLPGCRGGSDDTDAAAEGGTAAGCSPAGLACAAAVRADRSRWLTASSSVTGRCRWAASRPASWPSRATSSHGSRSTTAISASPSGRVCITGPPRSFIACSSRRPRDAPSPCRGWLRTHTGRGPTAFRRRRARRPEPVTWRDRRPASEKFRRVLIPRRPGDEHLAGQERTPAREGVLMTGQQLQVAAHHPRTPPPPVRHRSWPSCSRTSPTWSTCPSTVTSSTIWAPTPWSWRTSAPVSGSGPTCRPCRCATSTGTPRSPPWRRPWSPGSPRPPEQGRPPPPPPGARSPATLPSLPSRRSRPSLP